MSRLSLKEGLQDCCFRPDECQYTCPRGSINRHGKNCVNSFADCECKEGYRRHDRKESCERDDDVGVLSEGKSEMSSERDFRSACAGQGKQFCGPWQWWTADCPDECVSRCRRDRDRRRSLLSVPYRQWPGRFGVRT